MPSCYVIGGPNGSGKTMVALSLLPSLGIAEFVNADAIAAGLSLLNPEGMALQAGRLMLERLQGLAEAGIDFALDDTGCSHLCQLSAALQTPGLQRQFDLLLAP